MKPPEGAQAARRRLQGQHFTSPDVADLMCALAIGEGDRRILDPACGDGAILERASARMAWLAAGNRRGSIEGVELDPELAARAARRLPGASIRAGDFLAGAAGGPFDAVVGNPPYVRQELLGPDRKSLPGPGRADLHVRFWAPALACLREGGRLGMLTSNSWLDAGYGGELRALLAGRFRLVALVESEVESWFSQARVRTVLAVVSRSAPAQDDGIVLARLQRRLDEIVPPGVTGDERLERFDRLARRLERGDPEALRGIARVRRVQPRLLGAAPWGARLRQPDTYFDLLRLAGDRLVPLDSVATVRWGIKTGDDRFFFHPACGPLEVEERFLRPAVFSLMEIDRVVIGPAARRRLLVVDHRDEPDLSSAPRLASWIERAESQRGSDRRPTCAARRRAGRRWYELRPGPAGRILWSIMHQYRHLAPLNASLLPANDNLLLVDPRDGIEAELLAALLNSHLQAFIKQAFGRHRNEGMLKTQASDVRRMLVPDPRRLDSELAGRLLQGFRALACRPVGKIPQECARQERQDLDLAALEAAGLAPREARARLESIRQSLVASCGSERAWERDALRRRRHGAVRTAAPA